MTSKPESDRYLYVSSPICSWQSVRNNWSKLPHRFPSLSQVTSSMHFLQGYFVDEVLDGARTAVSEVKSYIGQVEGKIDELKTAQKTIIKKNQDAILNLFVNLKLPAISVPEKGPISAVSGTLQISAVPGTLQISDVFETRLISDVPGKRQIHAKQSNLAKLQLAQKLQKISQEFMNARLIELMQETETLCAKLKDNADLCNDDIETLKRCLQSWKNAKAHSFEEEKQKKRRLEDEEQKRREQEEREKKEKEKQKREEKEQTRREKEEAERKAEVERRRKEEAERQAEVERRRKEEAERQAEEERRRKEEAERQAEVERRRKEEAERKTEEERRRKEEAERKAKEQRIRKEEAERKAEEERRRKEEAERRAEEERRRKEAERKTEKERRRKEEAERKAEEERRRKEEAERKAEEERRRKEEEERQRMEDELLRKREEEECIKRKKEEERQRKEEERKRREKEAARKREEEKQRLEVERRERERLQKEAEERAWAQDPNNWNPVTYSRDCDEVDGQRDYHGGIKCIMASPPGGIEKDDLECNASDEVDSIIEILETDEKPVSSIIDIHSTKGHLHSEVPTRIYIPHYSGFSYSDEIVVKISLDQKDWVTVSPISTTSNMDEQEKLVKKLAGVAVNDFSTLKAIVVTRPRCQTIIVDKPGLSVHSTMDKNVKLFVPRDAFSSRTELKLMVQSVSDQTLASLMKDNTDIDTVLAASSVITLTCGKHPAKAIEVDLMKSIQKQNNEMFQRGKTYQMYTTNDKVWKFADVEYKGHQDQLTILLPAGREKYSIMELDMPRNFPKENVPAIADALHTCINNTIVVMIVKQHAGDLNKCAFRIVRREIVKVTLDSLKENGYTEGPDASAEFSLQEGQQLEVSCTGNIENTKDATGKNILTYLTYMGGAAADITLRVKDTWKQKDLPAYVGTIRCTLLRRHASSEKPFLRSVELTISIPKPVRPRATIGVARVRFPYYLTTLASYFSEMLCKNDQTIWQAVLRSLLDNSKFSSAYRIAKRKLVEDSEEALCRTMLLDWMKAKAVHEDKLEPITVALRYNGLGDIADLCVDFVRFQKENLTDAVLTELAQGITKDIQIFGQDLGLDSKDIESCITQHSDIRRQYIDMMMKWRESDQVIRQGHNALEYLRNICV